MKELQSHNQDKVKIIKQAEVKHQQKFLGSMRAIPGLTLFQMDMSTGKITEAQYDEMIIDAKGAKHRKLKFDGKCMYVQALNLSNAKRKFTKRAKQIINNSSRDE